MAISQGRGTGIGDRGYSTSHGGGGQTPSGSGGGGGGGTTPVQTTPSGQVVSTPSSSPQYVTKGGQVLTAQQAQSLSPLYVSTPQGLRVAMTPAQQAAAAGMPISQVEALYGVPGSAEGVSNVPRSTVTQTPLTPEMTPLALQSLMQQGMTYDQARAAQMAQAGVTTLSGLATTRFTAQAMQDISPYQITAVNNDVARIAAQVTRAGEQPDIPGITRNVLIERGITPGEPTYEYFATRGQIETPQLVSSQQTISVDTSNMTDIAYKKYVETHPPKAGENFTQYQDRISTAYTKESAGMSGYVTIEQLMAKNPQLPDETKADYTKRILAMLPTYRRATPENIKKLTAQIAQKQGIITETPTTTAKVVGGVSAVATLLAGFVGLSEPTQKAISKVSAPLLAASYARQEREYVAKGKTIPLTSTAYPTGVAVASTMSEGKPFTTTNVNKELIDKLTSLEMYQLNNRVKFKQQYNSDIKKIGEKSAAEQYAKNMKSVEYKNALDALKSNLFEQEKAQPGIINKLLIGGYGGAPSPYISQSVRNKYADSVLRWDAWMKAQGIRAGIDEKYWNDLLNKETSTSGKINLNVAQLIAGSAQEFTKMETPSGILKTTAIIGGLSLAEPYLYSAAESISSKAIKILKPAKAALERKSPTIVTLLGGGWEMTGAKALQVPITTLTGIELGTRLATGYGKERGIGAAGVVGETLAANLPFLAFEIPKYSEVSPLKFGESSWVEKNLVGTPSIEGAYTPEAVKGKIVYQVASPEGAAGRTLFPKAYEGVGTAAKTARYVYLDFGRLGSVPLAGIEGFKVFAGAPEVGSLLETRTPFVLNTDIDRKVLLNAMRKSGQFTDEQITNFKSAFSNWKYLQFARTAFLDKNMELRTQTINAEGIKKILKFVDAHKSPLIYGSAATFLQIRKPLLASDVPGDIDLALTRYSEQETKLLAQQLAKELRAAGNDVWVEPETTLIRARVNGEVHNAVDLHSRDSGAEEMVAEQVAGMPYAKTPERVNGRRYMALGESGLRALTTTYQLGEGGFGPLEEQRVKDVYRYFRITESSIKSGNNPDLIKKQLADLGREFKMFEKRYPDLRAKFAELDKSQVSLGGGVVYPAESAELFSFIPPKPSPSVSPKVASLRVSFNVADEISSMGVSPSPSSLAFPSSVSMASKSASVSPSVSLSVSPSVSPSLSPSRSVSPSKSVSPSVSLSPSLSPSPSFSPSYSPSISPSLSPPYVPPPIIVPPSLGFGGPPEDRNEGRTPTGRVGRYEPDILAMAGFAESVRVQVAARTPSAYRKSPFVTAPVLATPLEAAELRRGFVGFSDAIIGSGMPVRPQMVSRQQGKPLVKPQVKGKKVVRPVKSAISSLLA